MKYFFRIFCGLILLVGIFFLPWPVYLAMAALFAMIFAWYWEAIFFIFFADSFSSLQNSFVYGRFGIMFFVSVIFVFALEYARGRLRIYEV